MFEFRIGSLGGPSPTGDRKKRFSLLGMGFWLFRSLLVQPSSSSICLPTSSQVRMCLWGGRGRKGYKDTLLKRGFLARKPTEWVVVRRGPFNFAFDSEFSYVIKYHSFLIYSLIFLFKSSKKPRSPCTKYTRTSRR